jgi:hypothetical protein
VEYLYKEGYFDVGPKVWLNVFRTEGSADHYETIGMASGGGPVNFLAFVECLLGWIGPGPPDAQKLFDDWVEGRCNDSDKQGPDAMYWFKWLDYLRSKLGLPARSPFRR